MVADSENRSAVDLEILEHVVRQHRRLIDNEHFVSAIEFVASRPADDTPCRLQDASAHLVLAVAVWTSTCLVGLKATDSTDAQLDGSVNQAVNRSAVGQSSTASVFIL